MTQEELQLGTLLAEGSLQRLGSPSAGACVELSVSESRAARQASVRKWQFMGVPPPPLFDRMRKKGGGMSTATHVCAVWIIRLNDLL